VGRSPKAIGYYEEALRLRPDSAEVHCNLGSFLLQVGKLPEAVEQFEQALRISPEYVEAHFNLGLALEKLGRTPETIEHYQQALKLRPDFVPRKKRPHTARSLPINPGALRNKGWPLPHP
jgi:superkiller protein 3